MNCPECSKKRGRPRNYELPTLLDHMLESHPQTLITIAREIVRENMVEMTDVEIVEAPDGP